MAMRLGQRALFRFVSAEKILRCASTAASTREVLLNVPETKVTKLPNGFRVATEDSGYPTCTVGLWIDAGSRYETAENNGVAHFLEHMIFKGTNKRTQSELELQVENMGAHLNAYTSREQTVYYAKCFSSDLDRAVELLSDILLNSRLSEQAMEVERDVILREMQDVENNMQEVVFDHMHTAGYQGTPLSYTILGPTKNIKSLQRKDLQNYINTHYKAPRIVLAGAGGVNHEQLVSLAEKHFGKMSSAQPAGLGADLPCRFTGSDIRHRNDYAPFCYAAMAVEGCGWTNPDSIPLMIASMLLGSWDRTQGAGVNTPSRLAQKLGWGHEVQSFQAFNTAYKDTGLWGVYFVCDPMSAEAVSREIQSEWRYLCSSIGEQEVSRGKNMLRTNMLLPLDGTTPICEDIGRQMICYGRRIPLHEWDARINAVTVDSMKEAISKYIYDRDLVCSAYGQCENLEDYWIMRSKMSWWRM